MAAIRAAQLGMKVACVDRQYLGGTCLNVGCIPSKALLDSSERFYEARTKLAHHGIKVGDLSFDLPTMLGRKDQVVKPADRRRRLSCSRRTRSTPFIGTGRIVAPDTVEVTPGPAPAARTRSRPSNILIATGSAPIELPGLTFDGKYVVGSTEALSFTEVPKKLIVVGGGYIGVELGSVWSRLGSEVLVLEFTDHPAAADGPGTGRHAAPHPGKAGDEVQVQRRRHRRPRSRTGRSTSPGRAASRPATEVADRVLVATGRRPVTDGLGLDEIGVEIGQARLRQGGPHFATNVPGVYAIGDVIGGLMLAHKAEEEGIAAAEIMAGKAGHVNYHTVPGVVYTHPELAQVGLTEADAKRDGYEIKVGKFPMTANGRAMSIDDAEGMVKIVGDARSDRLLGVQILAPHASDMIAECVVAMEFAASVEDLARSFHAHPTLEEAIKEAALAVEKRAIHV